MLVCVGDKDGEYVGKLLKMEFVGGIRCVFVGAFSEFGGPVYRIPAPIFGVFREKWSTEHQ
jgi:hypothetical protein